MMVIKKNKEKKLKMNTKKLISILNSQNPQEAYNYIYTKLVNYFAFQTGANPNVINNLFNYCASQNYLNTEQIIHNSLKSKVFNKAKSNGGAECVCCGETHELTMHHVRPRALNPELQYDPDNIILLCGSCHRRVHGLINDELEEEEAETLRDSHRSELSSVSSEELIKGV